jgi:hypothetical protein
MKGQDEKQYHQNWPEYRTTSSKNKILSIELVWSHSKDAGWEIPKQALQARSEGRQPKGRRRMVWGDNIQLSLKERKCTWQEAVIRVQDCAAW